MSEHEHNVVLIGVVASHLATPERRRFFDCMLGSVLAQTKPLNAIYVGLSGLANAHCVFPLPMPVTCTLRHASLTQGQMWYELAREHALDGKDTYIVFGDDDDIWHNERVAYYARVLAICRANHPAPEYNISDVQARCYATDAGNVDTFARADAKTYEDVDAMIECGDVMCTSHDACNASNYWDFCVQAALFWEFFCAFANDFMLANTQCDQMFKAFVRTYRVGDDGNRSFRPFRQPPEAGLAKLGGSWMLYWRKHKDSACVSLRTLQRTTLNIGYEVGKNTAIESAVSNLLPLAQIIERVHLYFQVNPPVPRNEIVRHALKYMKHFPVNVHDRFWAGVRIP